MISSGDFTQLASGTLPVDRGLARRARVLSRKCVSKMLSISLGDFTQLAVGILPVDRGLACRARVLSWKCVSQISCQIRWSHPDGGGLGRRAAALSRKCVSHMLLPRCSPQPEVRVPDAPLSRKCVSQMLLDAFLPSAGSACPRCSPQPEVRVPDAPQMLSQMLPPRGRAECPRCTTPRLTSQTTRSRQGWRCSWP
jgi:hypothetical protein